MGNSTMSSAASPRDWRRGPGACAAGRFSLTFPPLTSLPNLSRERATHMTRSLDAPAVPGCTGAALTADGSKHWCVKPSDRRLTPTRKVPASVLPELGFSRFRRKRGHDGACGGWVDALLAEEGLDGVASALQVMDAGVDLAQLPCRRGGH